MNPNQQPPRPVRYAGPPPDPERPSEAAREARRLLREYRAIRDRLPSQARPESTPEAEPEPFPAGRAAPERVGVCFDKRSGKWRAWVSHRGEQLWLGTFGSAEAAHLARLDWVAKNVVPAAPAAWKGGDP
jgi:hypothetical protein